MGKKLLREYYELCEGGVCQDLLTEAEKKFVAEGGMILSGKLQEADVQNGNGRIVMGKVQVLDTPSGQVLKSLVQSGVKLGISSRGMGSVTESANGETIVEDDFQLICFDFVSEPSTPNAFMMREAKEFKNNVFTKADRINRLLNEVLEDE
jgi:hypothetical protein